MRFAIAISPCARQQFDRTHFAHVHAHRIGGSTRFGFDRGQRGRRFFRRQFIGGAFTAGQQIVRIGGHLVYGDPHVVDHADDVFDLIRVGDVVRQVIVDLGVGQESLLLTLGNQLFQTGLLLSGISAHETSTSGCWTRTRRPRKNGAVYPHYGSQLAGIKLNLRSATSAA